MTSTTYDAGVAARLARGTVLLLALSLLAALAVTLTPRSAFGVSVPVLTLSPATGPAGTSVVASAAGLRPRARGWVTFDTQPIAAFRTDRGGRASVRFTVPAGAARTVAVRATASEVTATTSFFVTAPGTVLPVEPAPIRTAPTSAPPTAGGYFPLRPVGSWRTLPGDAEAAAQVRRSTWEPRPQNARANATVPSGLALGAHGGVSEVWNSWLLPRVTGRFTGTTDEIIQWAAVKWGLPDEVLRAQMINESSWYQGLLDSAGRPINGKGYGDYTTNQAECAPGYTAPCPLSFGVLQIKYARFHPGTFPHSRDSTAFNVDYLAALMRGCYEGWETWLADYGSASGGATNYAAGDLYGCLGRWYAGQWHTPAADDYIASAKNHLSAKPWLRAGF